MKVGLHFRCLGRHFVTDRFPVREFREFPQQNAAIRKPVGRILQWSAGQYRLTWTYTRYRLWNAS